MQVRQESHAIHEVILTQ